VFEKEHERHEKFKAAKSTCPATPSPSDNHGGAPGQFRFQVVDVPLEVVVQTPVAPVFGGVDGGHQRQAQPVAYFPRGGVHQPVMGVHQVKGTENFDQAVRCLHHSVI